MNVWERGAAAAIDHDFVDRGTNDCRCVCGALGRRHPDVIADEEAAYEARRAYEAENGPTGPIWRNHV